MKKLILLFSLLGCQSEIFAWGKIGHRVVGEVAERNIDAKTKKAIQDLLANDDLARASTWADEIRSEPKVWGYSFPWHYVSIPDGKSYFDQKRAKEGDVIEVLFRLEDVIRDTKQPKEERVKALRFYIHFLGDLHQPLHVGRADDMGGNRTKLAWFKKDTNLHAVWDEDLIKFEELSYTEYSTWLNKYSEEEKKEWVKGTYVDWAKESQDLRAQVYDTKTDNLSYEYHYAVKKIYEERLKKGGLRLAYMLNKMFKPVELLKPEIEIRLRIKDNI